MCSKSRAANSSRNFFVVVPSATAATPASAVGTRLSSIIVCSFPCLEEHRKKEGYGCRRGFALQIEGLERVQESVLHGKEGGSRAGRRAGLGVDALNVRPG